MSAKRLLPLLSLALLCSALFSCKKKDDASGSDKIPVIDGYRKFAVTAAPMGIEGTPADHTEETDSIGAIYKVAYYPNPAAKVINFHLLDPYDAQSAKHVRLIRAKANGKIPDPYPFNTNDPSWNKAVLDESTTAVDMALDLSQFPYGYYRLEVTMAGRTFYAAILHQDAP